MIYSSNTTIRNIITHFSTPLYSISFLYLPFPSEELNRLALDDYKNSTPSLIACVKDKEEKIFSLSKKLERLLNGYLDQDIEKEIYRFEKAKLLLSKKSLELHLHSKPFSSFKVPGEGLEPSRPIRSGDFKSPMSTIPSPRHYPSKLSRSEA